MKSIYDRTRMLLGEKSFQKIHSKNIIIFGLGGVGGYAAEALVRAGIKTLTLVDHSRVEASDLNRQLVALQSTLGKNKTEVMAARILDINPEAETAISSETLDENLIKNFAMKDFDYVIDALDQIPDKLLLIQYAKSLGVPIISSMSMGNRFDPTQLKVGDIGKARMCPMSKLIRKEIAKSGIKDLKVVYSTENPHREELPEDGSRVPSSISFLPAAAGLMMASEVVKDLLLWEPGEKMIFGIRRPQKSIKIDY